MRWNQLYRLKSYLNASLWIVPFAAILCELCVSRIIRWLDGQLGLTLLDLTQAGAVAMLQATVSAMLAFLVFTFGSLLVAIQVASAQLTPRIIATTLLRNNVVKYTVGLFIFTLMFALSAQNRLDKDVYQLVLLIVALLLITCFAAFFYLIDYAARLLRPITILGHVGKNGIDVIKAVYPESSGHLGTRTGSCTQPSQSKVTVYHHGHSGIVLAVNVEVLISIAKRTDGVLEFVPQVGDFVAVDEPLFELYGGASAVAEQELYDAVVFGSERTMEQDPTFAFRIVVDIALRALSPAINDPTTAVLAIDQLHRLLRTTGLRHLRTDEVVDQTGDIRLIFRTPNWEDFVNLACSEIRASGSNNLQIVRRLRSMIENLIQTLPVDRQPILREQLSLLDRETERHFVYAEELALARVADSQGLGGRSGLAN